jgi:hypothetical protein
MKSVILTFFDSYPPKTGSGVVCVDFFNLWPSKSKKLFQFSLAKKKEKNIETINIFRNKPFFKLIGLPIMILRIIKYFKDEKKKMIIIEGPSWIFYSFVVIFFFRIYYKNVSIIYRSHSVEYEIRKKNSSKIIQYLTKIMENYVINKSTIATSVSKKEKNIFKKYYKKKTYLFPNSIDLEKLKFLKPIKKKNIPEKFILFCGSYDYKPNKEAIDFIRKEILTELIKKNIYLVLTGNHKINFEDTRIYNLGFISMGELKYLHNKSICLFTPIKEGYGTRIKILEALAYNNRIISTIKGIEGIEFQSNKNIKIVKHKKEMINQIIEFSKVKKKKTFNKFMNNYSMRINSKKLFNSLSL